MVEGAMARPIKRLETEAAAAESKRFETRGRRGQDCFASAKPGPIAAQFH
jgi:hypothetical protein